MWRTLTMNLPKIEIYVTPYSIGDLSLEKNVFDKTRGIYKPPQDECDIIIRLQKAGYSPTINAVTPCDKVAASSVCGFAYCLGGERFYSTKEVIEKPIFALIWFQKEIPERDLEIISTYFAEFFGINPVGRRIVTRHNKYLLDNGCFDPPALLPQLSGTNII